MSDFINLILRNPQVATIVAAVITGIFVIVAAVIQKTKKPSQEMKPVKIIIPPAPKPFEGIQGTRNISASATDDLPLDSNEYRGALLTRVELTKNPATKLEVIKKGNKDE